jgi:hypothetical protein
MFERVRHQRWRRIGCLVVGVIFLALVVAHGVHDVSHFDEGSACIALAVGLATGLVARPSASPVPTPVAEVVLRLRPFSFLLGKPGVARGSPSALLVPLRL